jgi:hypothetical protein
MTRWLKPLIAGLALSCGSITHAQTSHGQATTKPSVNSQGEKGEPVITLERDPGYWGMAPAYKILIYADGSVVYIGEKNVKVEGRVNSSISQPEVQRLVRAFEEIGYFSLLDKYAESGGCPAFLFDGPGASTELRLGDKKKSVFHDSGCLEKLPSNAALPYPKGLSQLEDLIDAVVKSARWVTGAEPPIK